ncbi:unnamed protein product [Clonostachys byssicola]|uniref:Uncharacterized protein n=1 Tax=Clonostachys byssicola TaxID=160290 RepID=A0A9N9URD2_9HYPO|nr:unnamed protein product [Clonostachys byssicola]
MATKIIAANIEPGSRTQGAEFQETQGQVDVPWEYLHSDFYPETPPISSSASESDLALSFINTKGFEDKPIVAVLGVGYVGSHLVETFSSHFRVIGFDVSSERVRELSEKYETVSSIEVSSNPRDLAQATHFLISVPTLLRPDRSIDSSYLREALRTVGMVARRGSTIVIESSVAVGMTRQLLGPLAEECGFFAGMSPERVDPGRKHPSVQSIPKIISGLDDIVPGSLDSISNIYGRVFDNLVPVSTPEVAEMTKLYENCQRMVCIAYANEMADACISHGINPFEVCDAASTKPFGFMSYTPGIGVGGHCIPINPFYLLSNNSFPLLEKATKIMWSRPAAIAERAIEQLDHFGKGAVLGSRPRILVVGMAFKTGQSSLSNSPGLELAKHLVVSQQFDVTWADALVDEQSIPQIKRLPDNEWCKDILEMYDMIFVCLKQCGMDLELLKELENPKIEMWCR